MVPFELACGLRLLWLGPTEHRPRVYLFRLATSGTARQAILSGRWLVFWRVANGANGAGPALYIAPLLNRCRIKPQGGSSMNTYNVTLSYEDRKGSSESRTIKVDASNIAGAIGKATREFVKSLDRKQRFDMNKGLKIEAARVTSDTAGTPDVASEASA
jgi:hypothetical protein